MDILEETGKKIGHWESREIPSPSDLLPHLPESQYTPDLIEIMADIREKISCFPVIELTHIEIYDRANRKYGYGRQAMRAFLSYAKTHGYAYAIVKIGKLSLDDSLDANTDFYTESGWIRFATPTDYSLRFAYFDLAHFA
jgi:hypothetical protein